jgi:hypothetical protein
MLDDGDDALVLDDDEDRGDDAGIFVEDEA